MVFSCTPIRLREHYRSLKAFQDELEALDESQEPSSAEELDEADAEIDTADSDDPEPAGDEDFGPDASQSIGEDERINEQAVLDLNDCYRICVIPRNDGPWQCRFQPPAWMLARSRLGADPLPALLNGLNDLAAWLEQRKQAFLREPSPERYAQTPCGTFKAPAVTQKGLLSMIAQPDHDGWAFPNDQDFSRVKDKIWIFWLDLCMPIDTLFSSDFKFAWAVARCEDQAPASD